MGDTKTPAMQKVKAIDVKPYRYGLWCTMPDGKGGQSKPFTNAIESRRWSEDGRSIWFMLGTHNFLNAKPEEELTLVPIPESEYVDRSREEAECARFLTERPCETCSGSGKVHT